MRRLLVGEKMLTLYPLPRLSPTWEVILRPSRASLRVSRLVGEDRHRLMHPLCVTMRHDRAMAVAAITRQRVASLARYGYSTQACLRYYDVVSAVRAPTPLPPPSVDVEFIGGVLHRLHEQEQRTRLWQQRDRERIASVERRYAQKQVDNRKRARLAISLLVTIVMAGGIIALFGFIGAYIANSLITSFSAVGSDEDFVVAAAQSIRWVMTGSAVGMVGGLATVLWLNRNR